jgi:hypothetical protein
MAKITKSYREVTLLVICHSNTKSFENLLIQIKSLSWVAKTIFFDTSSKAECGEFIATTLNSKGAQNKVEYQVISKNIPIAEFNFSKIRNSMLNLVTTKWFMFLDSDELLSTQAYNEIPSLISKVNSQKKLKKISAISLQRKDIFLGGELRHGETKNNRVVRVGKVGMVEYRRNVHEIVVVAGKIYQAKAPIHHFAHSSIFDFINSVTEYSYLESLNRTKTAFSFMELLVYPTAKLLKTYILKAGFLDGYRGLIYSLVMSLHSFFVRIYVWTK